MYRRYRISNNHVLLADTTTSYRNNRLKSDLTTLGPSCRLLGLKMSDFSACLLTLSLLITLIFNSFYATVICISDPLGAMDTGDIVELKCRGLTSDASGQCRRYARVFMFCYNSLYGLVSSCFRCLNSILNAHNCQFLIFKSL